MPPCLPIPYPPNSPFCPVCSHAASLAVRIDKFTPHLERQTDKNTELLADQPPPEWANKKVVVFSVPGAFTPGCSAKHLPGYIENLAALKAKGVDIVATIAFNDAWVMSAWGKANGIKNDDIVRFGPFLGLLDDSLGGED